MPKIVDAEIQRGEIRSAARRVFAERGVRGTGLAHVADAVGMGRSSLYHYYPDKDALLADLVQEMLQQELALFRACLHGDGTPLARLERLARACGALFPEWAAFGRMILDLRLEDAGVLKAYFRSLRRDLSAVISEGQRDGSLSKELGAEVAASVLIGAIDGLLLQYFIDARALPKPAELAEALCTTTRRILIR
jgi:AcrR family transcriptional regulator